MLCIVHERHEKHEKVFKTLSFSHWSVHLYIQLCPSHVGYVSRTIFQTYPKFREGTRSVPYWFFCAFRGR